MLIDYSTPISRKIRISFIAAISFIIMLLCLGGCSCSATEQVQEQNNTGIATLEASDTPALPSDGETSQAIDFAALQEQNPDVYAWLYIPDTHVNYPVLQNPLADNYYLVRDMYENPADEGAIYTQSINAKDFSDPVTLIYGHTFEAWSDYADVMFGTLHNFEDKDFFESHPEFYIYTPDKVLIYEVVSAYEYDNRHILNSFDFNDPSVVQSYFDYVSNPDSMVKNVREGVSITQGQDKIVQLSTCTRPANDSARYLVTGVLVDEQPTN